MHNLVAWREHLPWLEAEREAGPDRADRGHALRPGAFDELERALRTRRFETVQVPFNPFERECEERLLPLAEELGVARDRDAAARRGRARPPTRPRPESSSLCATSASRRWPQALLKWSLSDERVDVAIPATRDPEHARENAAAGEPPWFGPDERRLVERLAAA